MSVRGNWGKNLVRNFAQLGALAAVCDNDEERLAIAKKEYKDLRTTTNLQVLLDDPHISAIVVASPKWYSFCLG